MRWQPLVSGRDTGLRTSPPSDRSPREDSTTSAILFGSVGAIADTSELQRQAFNEASTAHGLDWNWDQEEYRDLLQRGGGPQRIADHASSLGQRVDAAAVHAMKSATYQETLGRTALQPRAGVVDTIREAKTEGPELALVTTPSPGNVAALLSVLSPAVQASDFDLVVDSPTVDRPEPDAGA